MNRIFFIFYELYISFKINLFNLKKKQKTNI